MGIRRREVASATAIAAAATAVVAASAPARAQPKTESTWDLIKRTGKVRMGIFDYPPYFLRDKASGEWVGAMVEMAKDIAKELDVKLEMVEVGGFAEAVLSLQANKVDMNFGLQATPKRATAIDFAGPIYWIEWVTVNNPKFHGKVWADYNKPDVKVAVMTGTSDELLLRKMAPKATRVEIQGDRAGGARGLVGPCRRLHHHGAGQHGDEAQEPRPRRLRQSDAARRAARLHRHAPRGRRSAGRSSSTAGPSGTSCWAYNETRMRASLKTLGIDEIPSTVSFSPN